MQTLSSILSRLDALRGDGSQDPERCVDGEYDEVARAEPIGEAGQWPADAHTILEIPKYRHTSLREAGFVLSAQLMARNCPPLYR